MGSRITEARRKAEKHWDKCVSTSISCPAADCCNRSMGGPLTKSVVDTSWHLQIPSLCIHLLVCCLYLQNSTIFYPKEFANQHRLDSKIELLRCKKALTYQNESVQRQVAFTKIIQSHQNQSDHIKPPCNAKLPHGTMHISVHSFFPITSLPFPVSFVCFGGAGRRGCVGRWPRNWKMQMGRSITPYLCTQEPSRTCSKI